MNKEIEEKYMEIMLKNYFQQTEDIRPCPNNKCNYYVFLPTNRYGQEFYSQQCSKIFHIYRFKWVDKQYLSYDKLFILRINHRKNLKLSSVFEFISTQECANCYSISKIHNSYPSNQQIQNIKEL
ncbi:unnamed protein product [Paramecium sonneborni]|uniref:Uncharacterized protein n=1 Tax=Paramecium sonneborni TaxID=65129 RepID=A0A8S1RMB0_9CILI|nr:unnamed protein product [Paramecium sonneborni]